MNDFFKLKGKTVFVSGATGYLGEAISQGLASAGANLILNGRNSNKLQLLKNKLIHFGGNYQIACFDINDEKKVSDFFCQYSGALHSLVNNAYVGGSGTLLSSSSKDFRESYEIGVVAVSNLIRAAIPHLKKSVIETLDASIVNVASMYGMVSPHLEIYENENSANPPFYGAAKAALIQLSKYTAVEFASFGIRVNAVSPGAFPSVEVQQNNPKLVNNIISHVPLKKIGQPNEIVGPILFLVSSASQYVTGINLPVDGGWTAW